MLPAATVGLVVLAVVGGLVVAVVTTERAEEPAAPVDGEVEVDADGQVVAPTADPPTCTPQGCARWSLPRLGGQGAVVVGDGVVVRTSRDPGTEQRLVEVREVDSGRLRWTAPVPFGGDDEVRDPTEVAVADGHVLLGFSALDDALARLVVFDLEVGGTPLVDTPLPSMRTVASLAWRDGRAVVYGTAVTTVGVASPRSLVVGVDGEGEIRWELDGYSVPGFALDVDPLLVRGDGTVARLEPGDGELVWEHPAGRGSSRSSEHYLALDRTAGHIARIDLDSGEVLATVAVDAAEEVLAVGPWIGVVADGGLRVFAGEGVDAHEVLFERDLAGPVAVTRIDGAVVVAWGDRAAETAELMSYSPDGTPLSGWQLGPVRSLDPFTLATLQPGTAADGTALVELVVDDGARALHVDPRVGPMDGEQRVPDAVQDEAERIDWWGATTVVWGDDVSVELFGSAGSITVDGGREAVSTDPPILAGPGGLIALDPALLDGR